MKFFKRKNQDVQISIEFKNNVQKAISLLITLNDSPNDETVLNLFNKNGINKIDSIEILLFLPVAFMRKLFYNLKWVDSYIEFYSEKNQVEKKFADSEPFQIIWQETEKYFESLRDYDEALKIARRSAEFNALNELLVKRPEAKPEEIILHKTCFLR